MSAKRFWIVFALAVVVIAGGVSYLASSSPDGLDSATLRGCEVVETPSGAEQLNGNCIAQHASEHHLATSPLADYTLFGHGATGGIAGILGAVVVLAVAGGGFWLIARSRKARN